MAQVVKRCTSRKEAATDECTSIIYILIITDNLDFKTRERSNKEKEKKKKRKRKEKKKTPEKTHKTTLLLSLSQTFYRAFRISALSNRGQSYRGPGWPGSRWLSKRQRPFCREPNRHWGDGKHSRSLLFGAINWQTASEYGTLRDWMGGGGGGEWGEEERDRTRSRKL